MKWTLSKERSLCPQIAEQICLGIASGDFLPNEKLLSVREVALAAGVNPNTVQRAFESLERDGILYSVRGSGWYVSENTQKANEVFQSVIAEKTRRYFGEMQALGFSEEQTKQYVETYKEVQAP